MENKFYSILGTIAALSAFGSIFIKNQPLNRVAVITLFITSALSVVLYFRYLIITKKKHK